MAKLHDVQDDHVKQLEAEMTVQHMITLNQQNLLEDSRLVAIFRNLEATDISTYFQKEELILNWNERSRLITCFEEIPKYRRQIRLGIVHEIYINTKQPEEYRGFIPEMYSRNAQEHSTSSKWSLCAKSGVFGRREMM